MKPTPLPNPGALLLLQTRERQGLRFSIVFSLIMMGVFVFVTLFSAQSLFESLVTLGIIGGAIVLLIGLLVVAPSGRFIHVVGWVLTAMYLLVIVALPWIWYHSVGGESVPRSYFLKVNIMPLVFIFLVLCSLPGRPAYPLVFTIGSSLSLCVIYGYALTDPRTVLAPKILDSVMGPAASLDLAVNNLVLNLASGVLLAFFLSRFRKTVIQASEAEHSTAQLGRYFSPGLVPLIARSESSFLKPGGQLQQVTVLFSDIRGFTTLSEGLEPARVVELLSLYQEQMVAAIFAHGGTLDKFIGDGIMATFGTPAPAADDSLRAVQTALSMQERLVALNQTLVGKGFPQLRQGIGIHSGQVIAGNVGTTTRLEYTVIGDTVNTASRVESLCKETGDDLLISEPVAAVLAGDASFARRGTLLPRGALPLKGKTISLAVFAVGRAQGEGEGI